MNSTSLTDVAGVAVGHWTDLDAATGVTVVSLPEPNRTAVEVRGAAPGTRETALLAPGMRIENIQAIVFSGGSAYGLAAADGVVRELEKDGRGHETMNGIVPIVPSAIVYDLGIGDPAARPGPEEGAAAYRAATSDPVAMGSVGAGTGAVVGGWRGFQHFKKGGVGSHALEVDDATVGALVVLNAVGDVFRLEGTPLTGGDPVPPLHGGSRPLGVNTTLVCVCTDASLSRPDLMRITVRSQDALAACLRPGHTRYDGDAAFAVSCGERTVSPDAVGEAAFVVVGRAIEAAVRHAEPLAGIPAAEDP